MPLTNREKREQEREAPVNGKAGESRKERLAVNLYDLERQDPAFRGPDLLSRLDAGAPVWVDRNRKDEHALVFCCPLLEAALIIDLLRSEDRKAGDPPTRAYVRRGALWAKLPGNTVLTELGRDGKARLSRKEFPAPIEAAPRLAPPPVRLI